MTIQKYYLSGLDAKQTALVLTKLQAETEVDNSAPILPLTSTHAKQIQKLLAEEAGSYQNNFSGEPDEEEFFLFLALYEQKQLLGIMKGIFCSNASPIVYCFVHPDHRKIGYFSNLLEHLLSLPDTEDCIEFPVYTESGAACAAAYEMERTCTEYCLVHSLNGCPPDTMNPSDTGISFTLTLLPVPADSETFAAIHSQCFDYPAAFSQKCAAQWIESGAEAFLIQTSSNQPIGCGLLIYDSTEDRLRSTSSSTATCWLCGFGILPGQRRKHYAYSALLLIENHAHQNGYDTLSLQVSDTNVAAFSLYKKAGFQTKSSFSNYVY